MSPKKITLLASASLILSGGMVSGLWYWHVRSQDEAESSSASSNTNTQGSPRLQPAPGPDSISLNTATSNAGQAGSSIPIDTSTPSGGGAKPAGSTPQPSGTDPNKPDSDFSQFDQYKTAENALYQDISLGSGAEAAAGKQLTVNYRGWLTTGALFDESYSKGKPFVFVPGQHQVIQGWETGVLGMKIGGKRRLIVPPKVGYGDTTQGPIPGGSVLVFDVELVGVQ